MRYSKRYSYAIKRHNVVLGPEHDEFSLIVLSSALIIIIIIIIYIALDHALLKALLYTKRMQCYLK